ncbi:family 1 encapsulin nanocompartment shell protein [Arthrobacter sp. KK5.5]|uniref:family 1 encapsulin nanocompartment shell protein n=1 Tax=Arthrobacter sp. KK5.5 TaxID=3373084 RepID=UPI003EE775A7
MTANHLLRELAPITEAGWKLLDDEARDRLTTTLGARKLVDFSGPFGWDYSATNLGRTESLAAPDGDGLLSRRRRVLPLAEMRVDFTVSRDELLDADRGAADIDLSNLDAAAVLIASAENRAVFHGWRQAHITGITQATTLATVPRVEDFSDYPQRVATAVAELLREGISGPFGLALGPGHYTAVTQATERGGYLLAEHLRRVLEGPIVWAPGVRGAVVMSLRGGDFLFESGQDLSIGYSHHDARNIHLYLEQSFSFRVATPEAAVHLTSGDDEKTP